MLTLSTTALYFSGCLLTRCLWTNSGALKSCERTNDTQQGEYTHMSIFSDISETRKAPNRHLYVVPPAVVPIIPRYTICNMTWTFLRYSLAIHKQPDMARSSRAYPA